MSLTRKVIFLFFILLQAFPSFGQQMPFNPISYRIFSPFLLNPAIAGSKDFFSTDVIAGFTGRSYSQVMSGNTRITKKGPAYTEASPLKYYTNFGAGLSGFNDFNSNDSTSTAGLDAALSYHIPLNKTALTFLSVGVAVKGMYHYYHGDYDLNVPPKEFYFPNIDFGVYFYGPSLYTGVSATNFLGAPEDTAKLNIYKVPVTRQYNFIAGYKIVLVRSLNIVLEPSLMIITDDSLSFSIKESIEPVLKLYAGNFCVGTYFNDYSKISFFFQYRYPKFYIGTYFALPKDSPYFKKTPTTEIAFGINFSRNQSGYNKSVHW